MEERKPRSWKDIKKSIDQKLTSDELQKMNTHIEISKSIIKNRTDKGWSQADLGKKAGLHQVQIARIENGDQAPTLKTLEKIAAALDLKISLEPIRDNLVKEQFPEHLDVASANVLISESEDDYQSLEISKFIQFKDFKEWANDHVLDCDVCQDTIAAAKEGNKDGYFVEVEQYMDKDLNVSDELINDILGNLPGMNSAENTIDIKAVYKDKEFQSSEVKDHVYKIDNLYMLNVLRSQKSGDSSSHFEVNGEKLYFNQFKRVSNDKQNTLNAAAADKKVLKDIDSQPQEELEYISENGRRYSILIGDDESLFLKLD